MGIRQGYFDIIEIQGNYFCRRCGQWLGREFYKAMGHIGVCKREIGSNGLSGIEQEAEKIQKKGDEKWIKGLLMLGLIFLILAWGGGGKK